MSPEEFQRLLEKFSRGACSPEEEQLVLDWYNNIGHLDEEPLGEIPQDDKQFLETRLWNAIRPAQTRGIQWPTVLLRAAVITIPLLVAAFLYFNPRDISKFTFPVTKNIFSFQKKTIIFTNTTEAPRVLTLADGSRVILHPSSEIVLEDGYGESMRKVHLTGEALFDVVHDPSRPFIVRSGEVVTRVLGTSFTVRAYENDNEITVAVKRGKVSVHAGLTKEGEENLSAQREVILTPNQQMVYRREREEVVKTLIQKPEIILPGSNLFSMEFEDAPVAGIFQVLEENYGIDIRYDAEKLARCRLTTKMSEEGLYERIQVICTAIGASYTIDNDAVITIESNGCL